MKFNYIVKNLKIPKKSFLGLKLLSSIESSLAAYFICLTVFLLSPFFGADHIELMAAKLFNIIAYSSLLILILNLFLKRNEINKNLFLILNIPLFLFLPYFFFSLIKNIFLLFNLIYSN